MATNEELNKQYKEQLKSVQALERFTKNITSEQKRQLKAEQSKLATIEKRIAVEEAYFDSFDSFSRKYQSLGKEVQKQLTGQAKGSSSIVALNQQIAREKGKETRYSQLNTKASKAGAKTTKQRLEILESISGNLIEQATATQKAEDDLRGVSELQRELRDLAAEEGTLTKKQYELAKNNILQKDQLKQKQETLNELQSQQGELMGMGIPIICNSGVGDVDFIVEKYKSGFVLKDLNKVGIYIDNSFSMSRSYQNQTLLESAKDDAIKLIDNLPDETKYVLTTNNKKNNKQYLINNNEIKKEIINLKTTAQTLTISEAIEIQHEQLKLEKLNSFWFTDLQENTLDLDKIKDESIIKNINILQYGSSSNKNISIDSVWFNKNNRTINNNENLNVKITNHSAEEVEFQTKLNINNGEVLNQSYNKIDPQQSAEIKFDYSVNEKGIIHVDIVAEKLAKNGVEIDVEQFMEHIETQGLVIRIESGIWQFLE